MAFFHFFKKKKASASAANIPPATTPPAIEKEDAIKMVFEKIMSEKPPSEHFASGSIFDITRLVHDEFVQLVQSNDPGLLHDFFANAYLSFCHNPQIVGFTPTMVDRQKDEDAVSTVMRNKASLGVATIGTVSGRGFELMGRFLDCIEQDS